MSTTVLLTAALALMGPPGAVSASAKASVASAHVEASDCYVSAIDEAQVSAREAGELQKFEVREGAKVKVGDLLAQIDDEVSRNKKEIADSEAEAAEAQAKTTTRIDAAVAGAKVAQAEWEQSKEANRRTPGTVSQTQLNKEELAATHAKLQIDLAKHEQQVAHITHKGKLAQVGATKIDIDRRQILAPFEGQVMQKFKNKGEWVNPGDPVLKIVRMDRVKVEGYLNAAEYAPIDVEGRPVLIEVELSKGRVKKFTSSKVDFVSLQVEANGDYRVRAEVDNDLERGHWVLRPGMPAKMTITLELPAVPVTAKGKTNSK